MTNSNKPEPVCDCYMLHRSEAVTEINSIPEIFWSDSLNAWVVTSPDLTRQVFRDLRFCVVDYRAELSKIQEKTDIRFPGSIHALSYVPLALERVEHKAARDRIARHLARVTDAVLKDFEARVSECVHIFDHDREIDLCRSFFQPLANSLVKKLTELESQECGSDEVTASQVFDRLLSLRNRKRVEEQINLLFRQPSDLTPDRKGVSVALTILGADAFLGSIQESFIDSVQRNPGRNLRDYDWQPSFKKSGVPYVERISRAEMLLGGAKVREGDRLRLMIDLPLTTGVEREHQFFGSGRHTCLGKNLSIRSWKILSTQLATLDRKVDILKVGYRKNDYVFNCPNLMKVKIYG